MTGLGKLRVAVVGAGAAGLCAARHLLSRGETFAPPVVYELTKHVGGTWVYEEKVGTYDSGLPILSSMYRDLRTNIPKEVMSFPDFPFEEHLPSFVHHTEVRKYLEKYCDHFRIRDHIQFATIVDSVKPVQMKEGWRGLAWDLTTSDGINKSKSVTERFDAVMVCNGSAGVVLSEEAEVLEVAWEFFQGLYASRTGTFLDCLNRCLGKKVQSQS